MNEFNEKIKILQNAYTAGNYAKVIDGCHRLDKKYPNNPFLFNLNGLALQALSNHKAAIKFFKAALDIDNSNIFFKNRSHVTGQRTIFYFIFFFNDFSILLARKEFLLNKLKTKFFFGTFFGDTGEIVRRNEVHEMGKILHFRSNFYAYI